MQITTNDIKENIDSAYYTRGLNYYRSNKILDYKIGFQDESSSILRAKVRGSYGRNYAIYIEIEKDEAGEIYIEGQCSCPIGYNCKHVAAVCIRYTTENPASRKTISTQITSYSSQISLVDKWLENLQNSTLNDTKQNTNAKAENGDYFLTYRLDGVSSSNKGLLTFYKSKILKNGFISKGTKLDAGRVGHGYSFRELKNEEDENIIQMADSFVSNDYYSTSSPLSGDLGYMIVKKVLATKRCYFDYNSVALSFLDEVFHTKYEFKLYKGEYSLKSNITKKGYKVIETTPPFLLDTLNNIVQELDIDIDTYRQLLNAPKIPKENIAKIYTSVANTLPNIDIETPKSIKTIKIKTKPTPKLHLKYMKDEEDKSFTSFSVDFNYERYSVKYMPRVELKSFYNEESKVEISRDLDYEDSVKKQIESYGFSVKIKDDNLAVVLVDENKQAQLKIWKEFLNLHVDELKSQGWLVETMQEFDMRFEPSSEVVVESDDKNDWFSLSFNLEFNGVSQPIAPLVSTIIQEFDNFENMPELVNIEVDENHFVEVQTKQIRPIIQTIIELLDKKDRDENLKISPYDAHLLEFMDDDIIWRGNKEILELSKKLKDFKGIKRVEPPKSLQADLRDYQQEGLNWLNFLYEFKFSGILADDMGLGKTIQTLAHLSKLKEDSRLTNPSLIVMPTSLIANWKNEAKKFTPNLSVLSLHGSDRADRLDVMDDYDVLLTTYPLIVRDQKRFNEHSFMYIILDEAQKIKNHKTKMAVALKTLKSDYRLALSGTPIENHLGELWSIFSFLMPGFLDTVSFFKNYYQTPIEKEHSFQRQTLLNKRVKPFMIRRTKEKVADELPAKSEIVKYTQFSDKQSKLYESIRVTMEKKVQEAVNAKGLGSSHITILDALLKLRQVCCDPSLVKIDEAKKVQESAKLELFLDLIDELLTEGRKILVFSQFTSMLAIIEERIILREIKYTKLTGSTRKREEAIEKFTDGGVDMFLISLKAGGVGLNLVEADTVIHYDPWWNPAVENQATDRAYRIGQTKAVFVYKLIVENTIEQKILELQKKKQALQDGIYDNDKQQDDIKFSGDELMELLK
ncbi:MAG: DEAD/DEAH box helicase [Campylobacterota bacterium]|nr:DEAD/DEAH box helicase [Campylobacterota bacterium]